MVKMIAATLPMIAVATSCSDLCADGGHGTTGFISGTAPACEGSCADCGDGHCYQVEKGSVSDYGSGCWSGNKVCCCSKEMHTLEASDTDVNAAAAYELIASGSNCKDAPKHIYNGKVDNWGQCQAKCDNDPQCNYYTVYTENWCQTDKTCNYMQKTDMTSAKTYHKVSKVAEKESLKIAAPVEPELKIEVSVPSCAGLCADGGHGSTGFISGTAPACEGACADCGDGHCYQVEKGSVSDYGHGCWSGNKVCCCSKEMHEASPSNQTSDIDSQAMVKTTALELVPAPDNVSSVPSCSGLCTDGGHGTTGFISGTAPACGGSCADCGDGHCYQVQKGSVSDYGHGCWTGSKVCCCSKEMQEASQTIM